MKIENVASIMPASNAANVKISSNSPPSPESRPVKAEKKAVNENIPVEDESPAREYFASELEESVNALNTRLESGNYDVRFKIDSDTRDVIVTVVDRESEEVIREIPAEEVLRMRARFQEMAGLLLEETV